MRLTVLALLFLGTPALAAPTACEGGFGTLGEQLHADLPLTGLTFRFRETGLSATEIRERRERESRELLRMLQGGVPTTDLEGVAVRPHEPHLVTSPAALTIDPATGHLTIHPQHVPEYMRPHLRRLAAQLADPRLIGNGLIDAIQTIRDIALDPAGALPQERRLAEEATAGYQDWANRHLVRSSQSNTSAGRERHLFRSPDGRRAVAHTLETDGSLLREILVVVDDGRGGLRLIAVAERRGRDGGRREQENQTCLRCHFLTLAGSIATRMPNSNRMRGRVPYLERFPSAHAISRW